MTTHDENYDLEEVYDSLGRDATLHGRDRRQSQPSQNVPDLEKIQSEITDHEVFQKNGEPHLAVQIDNGRRVIEGTLQNYEQS